MSESELKMEPLGAVIVSSVDIPVGLNVGRVSFMEARVSVTGTVIPWGDVRLREAKR